MNELYSELETYMLECVRPDADAETRKQAQEAESHLLSLLSPAQRAAYDAFRSADLDFCSEYESAIFRASFRLGVQLLCDILYKPA